MSDWGKGAINNTNGFGQAPKNDKDQGNFGKLCYDSDRGQQTNITGDSGAISNTKSMTNGGTSRAFITTGDITTMSGLSEFSFSFWAKLDQPIEEGLLDTLMYSGDNIRATNWSIEHRQEPGGNWVINLYVNSGTMVKINAPTDGSWHHYAFRINTTKGTPNIYEGYIDNVVQTNLVIPVSGSTLSAFYPGFFTALATGNVVVMNASAIFNRTITTTEINTIYNSGCPIDISSLNPTIYISNFNGATFDGLQWTLDCTGVPSGVVNSRLINAIITDSPCP